MIVADPSYAPMYATRSRRVKTDKRDARTLAEACRLGAYRAIHRVSDAQRHVRAELAPLLGLLTPINAAIARRIGASRNSWRPIRSSCS